MTRSLPTRRIGGSDIAALLGSGFVTPLALYLDLRGEAPPQPFRPELERGKALEPVILDLFAARTGQVVRSDQTTRTDPEYPQWLGGHVDALDAEGNPIEVKSVGRNTRAKDGELLWGPEGGDIPPYYYPQPIWYAGLTERPWTTVVALIGPESLAAAFLVALGRVSVHDVLEHVDMRTYRIPAQPKVYDAMRQKAVGFIEQHVIPGVPPDPRPGEESALWPQSNDVLIDATPEDLELIERARALKKAAAEATSEFDQLAARIRLRIGPNQGIRSEHGVRVTNKTVNSTRFDSRAFRAADPQTWSRFAKTTSSRRLLFLGDAEDDGDV